MPGPSRMRERVFALFLLGATMLVPPVLTIFNTSARFLGVPVLYLYLFSAWVTLIALVAFVVERVAATDELAETGEESTAQEVLQPTGVPHDA